MIFEKTHSGTILGSFSTQTSPPPKKNTQKTMKKKQNKKQKQEDTLVKMQLCHLKYSQG